MDQQYVHPIGARIRGLRKDNGMNQEAIAQKLGISIPAFSKIESGRTDVNLSRLEQLADIFGITVGHLLDGTAPERTALGGLREKLAAKEQEIRDLQGKIRALTQELGS